MSVVGTLAQKTVSSWNVRGIPRLIYSTRHLFWGKVPKLFKLSNGIRLFLDIEDYFQCMMLYGHYSPEILEVLEHFVKAGDHVVDIGAHVGYFSTYLGQRVTAQGAVYSFEPDPRAYERLSMSVQANQMDWVKTFPVALSAKSGQIEFYLSPQLGWSTAVKNSHLTDLQATIVKTIPFDTLVDEGSISSDIRLVKIDVEGLEVEVLSGMRRTIEKAHPILIAEVNGNLLASQGESCSSLLRLIRSLGYEVYSLTKKSSWFWHKKKSDQTSEYHKYIHDTFNLVPADEDGFEGDIICLPVV